MDVLMKDFNKNYRHASHIQQINIGTRKYLLVLRVQKHQNVTIVTFTSVLQGIKIQK